MCSSPELSVFNTKHLQHKTNPLWSRKFSQSLDFFRRLGATSRLTQSHSRRKPYTFCASDSNKNTQVLQRKKLRQRPASQSQPPYGSIFRLPLCDWPAPPVETPAPVLWLVAFPGSVEVIWIRLPLGPSAAPLVQTFVERRVNGGWSSTGAPLRGSTGSPRPHWSPSESCGSSRISCSHRSGEFTRDCSFGLFLESKTLQNFGKNVLQNDANGDLNNQSMLETDYKSDFAEIWKDLWFFFLMILEYFLLIVAPSWLSWGLFLLFCGV